MVQKSAKIKGEKFYNTASRGIVKTKKSHYAFNYWLYDVDEKTKITYIEPEFFYNRAKDRLIKKYQNFVRDVEIQHEQYLTENKPKTETRGRPRGETNYFNSAFRVFVETNFYQTEAQKDYSNSTFSKSNAFFKMLRKKYKNFTDKKIGEISAVDVTKLLNEINKGNKLHPQTVRRYKQFLSKPFEILLKTKIITDNPVTNFKVSKKVDENRKLTQGMRNNGDKADILSVREMEIVEENIERIHSKVIQTAIKFALLTGMRNGEINAVTWDDIDWENKRIYIYRTAEKDTKNKGKIAYKNSTKGGETKKNPRKVILYPKLERLLIEYKNWQDEEYSKRNIDRTNLNLDLLFLRETGTTYSIERFSRVWREYRDSLIADGLLVKKTVFNNLRGSFISKLLNTDKVPATVVKTLVGHKKIRTTLDFYSETTDQNLDDLYRELFQ